MIQLQNFWQAKTKDIEQTQTTKRNIIYLSFWSGGLMILNYLTFSPRVLCATEKASYLISSSALWAFKFNLLACLFLEYCQI